MMQDPVNSEARSAIFASIRENLAASEPFDADWLAHHGGGLAPLDRRFPAPKGSGDLLEEFKGSLQLLGSEFTFVPNVTDAAEQVRSIVTRLSAAKIVVSDSGLIGRIITSAGIDAAENPTREQLFSSDVGITSAQWAIAETGTLVLDSGAERHRLVSLVPPVHVCVLMASSIRRTMAEILDLLDPETGRAITFITGASRTSDIELTLAIGVHGPGELHVIVIAGE